VWDAGRSLTQNDGAGTNASGTPAGAPARVDRIGPMRLADPEPPPDTTVAATATTPQAVAGAPVDATGPFAGVAVALAGTTLHLLAARAAWWPAQRTLFVADVHLGKAETFRSLGVPVPDGPTEATLARLGALADGCGARRLVVLGDLLHARAAHAERTLGPLRAWRAARPSLECVLVRGNHDERAGDPPPDLGIEVVDEPAQLGPFALCHAPVAGSDAPPVAGYRLAGHLHPAVRLHGRAGDAARLPCFVVGAAQAVLPAFGDFTGTATVSRTAGATLYAVAGDRVFELPGRAAPAC
jgi:DNA ligase-associated metallophosphoesterase